MLACVAGVAAAASANARSPARDRHPPALRAAPSHALRPTSAAAVAYMSGRQPLVGWHAPSDKPVAKDAAGRPMLSLTFLNRRESLSIPAESDAGGFASLDLDRVAVLLRSMGGDEHPIDPRTLSLVYRIETHFGVPEVLVVSGYRVPKPGSHSNHGKGRAMDIILPGIADEEVAQFARDLGFVGVGVYPMSQFVHIDIRPRSYFWVDYTGPHMRNHESAILGSLAAQGDAAALARGQAPIEPFVVSMDVDAALRASGLPPPTEATDDEEDEED